jgi:hypothetical protein
MRCFLHILAHLDIGSTLTVHRAEFQQQRAN